MTPQQDVAGMLFWLLIILTAMVWAGIFIAKLVRLDRIEDAYPTQKQPAVCQIGKCGKPAVAIYDKHPSGSIYVCDRHDRAVAGWAGPYGRDVPYDQELAPGTDLQLWEKEL